MNNKIRRDNGINPLEALFTSKELVSGKYRKACRVAKKESKRLGIKIKIIPAWGGDFLYVWQLVKEIK